MPHGKADLTGKIVAIPPPPKLMGRPTKMNDLLLQKIEHGFSMGLNDVEACLYAGIVPATLYNYQKENPNFLERKRQLKANPVMRSKVTVVGDLEKVATAQWYLEHRSPEFRKEESDGGNKQQFNFFVSDTEFVRQLRDYVTGLVPGSMGADSQEATGPSEGADGSNNGSESSGQG